MLVNFMFYFPKRSTAFFSSLVLIISILPTARSLHAAESLAVVADFLERFNPKQVYESAATELRRPASAGGVKQNGLFEHPKVPGTPARVRYALELPTLSADELLLLAFDIAISDGVTWGQGADGVRFALEINGRQVFAGKSASSTWESHSADLTAWAGQTVQIDFLTDALSNTSFDWALWGSPRLLRCPKAASPTFSIAGPGKVRATIPTGALVLSGVQSTNLHVQIKPNNGSNTVHWVVRPQTAPAAEHFVRDFAFAKADSVDITWEPASGLLPSHLQVEPYPALLRFGPISTDRPLVHASQQATIQISLTNAGLGYLPPNQAELKLDAGNAKISASPVPRLEPNELWTMKVPWTPAARGPHTITGELRHANRLQDRQRSIEVLGPAGTSAWSSISNEFLKLEFVSEGDHAAFARIFVRDEKAWAQIGIWSPLFEIATVPHADNCRWKQTDTTLTASSLELTETGSEPNGNAWKVRLRVDLPKDRPAARVRYEWTPEKDSQVLRLSGPNLYPGEGSIGAAKTWGLFPGLEYLFGAERSSNPRDFAPPLDDRRTPQADKITIPLMAVTLGPDSQAPKPDAPRFFAPDSLKDQNARASLPLRGRSASSGLQSEFTIGLSWDPLQQWDGAHAFPSARFSSPNLDQGMDNHRIGLFLPSCPEYVQENAEVASRPFPIKAGQTLKLDANLFVCQGPATAAVREWLRDRGGLPEPAQSPRSFQEELDICRAGLLQTVWDARAEKWRHCIGWAPQHAPGFATLLWMDSQVAAPGLARQQSRARVDLAVTNILRDSGPGGLISQANCHILQWELPFHYGYLPQALDALAPQIQSFIQSQGDDGSWLYQPANREQADLGQAGDSVLGTCANRAATLLRYARITGDKQALAAGEKALAFMEHFRVPRGGQTWECPMYEPDILAAAYAIRAYHDGYRITGKARWLHDAVYWAESGVPFTYLWTRPDRPMMLGATIPVFGSTFYTHTWLAVPVQWCGLVYAYHVWHLAQELEDPQATAHALSASSPLPLALQFLPRDWKRLVELITVSAMHQQFDKGERIGTYPDSISDFARPNPAFINPEDILINVLALHGCDPDIKSARSGNANREIVISSSCVIRDLQAEGSHVSFILQSASDEPVHAMVAGVTPKSVMVNSAALDRLSSPTTRQPGWWWDEKNHRLFLVAAGAAQNMRVDVRE